MGRPGTSLFFIFIIYYLYYFFPITFVSCVGVSVYIPFSRACVIECRRVCRVVRVACVAWTSSGRLDPIRWSLFLVPRPRVNVAFRPSRGGAPQPVSDDCTAVVLTVRTDTHRTFICFYLFLFIISIIIILLLYYYYCRFLFWWN